MDYNANVHRLCTITRSNEISFMPDIASVMREEITRLSRRAAKNDLASLRRIAAQQRRHIAALRRELSQLAQQVSSLSRQLPKPAAPPLTGERTGKPLRFVAKGLRSHRLRLGLTAEQLAALMRVSDQTIYNWERGVTRPRPEQLAALAALRNLSKRDAHARLQQRPARTSDGRRKARQ